MLGVSPFMPNELLERESLAALKSLFYTGTVYTVRLQHVQSLRRQAFMYLSDLQQSLNVSDKPAEMRRLAIDFYTNFSVLV